MILLKTFSNMASRELWGNTLIVPRPIMEVLISRAYDQYLKYGNQKRFSGVFREVLDGDTFHIWVQIKDGRFDCAFHKQYPKLMKRTEAENLKNSCYPFYDCNIRLKLNRINIRRHADRDTLFNFHVPLTIV